MQTVTGMELKFRAWDRKQQKMIHEFYGPEILNMYDKIMLYTGLKDKNGNKIYEGDIVKYHYWNGNYTNSVVEFKKTEASDDMGTDMIGFQDFEGCEVIGNIFENPELLEVKK